MTKTIDVKPEPDWIEAPNVICLLCAEETLPKEAYDAGATGLFGAIEQVAKNWIAQLTTKGWTVLPLTDPRFDDALDKTVAKLSRDLVGERVEVVERTLGAIRRCPLVGGPSRTVFLRVLILNTPQETQ